MNSVLWFGRHDPNYSRNRIMAQLLRRLGCASLQFRPQWSRTGALEAWLRRLPKPDAVWVGNFRQRDLAAASRSARRWSVPLIADPLISAWDKLVFEHERYADGSAAAERQRKKEAALLARCDLVLADTLAHKELLCTRLEVPEDRVFVVHLGAEQPLFRAQPLAAGTNPPVVLFVASFIRLHGATVLADAVQRYRGPKVIWDIVGTGPELAPIQAKLSARSDVRFTAHVPYTELAARYASASIVLGIFGNTPKAGRVIPNKVYQGLAIGRPVITRSTEGVWPSDMDGAEERGLVFVPPADAGALADAVAELAADQVRRERLGRAAQATTERWFSTAALQQELETAMCSLAPHK